jgi:hypothetical protein
MPKNPNFIHISTLNDLKICDDIIKYHKKCPHKEPGRTFGGVNEKVKKSTDVHLDLNSVVGASYMNALQKVANEYITKYKYCNEGAAWGYTENIGIQHYAPGEGYFEWHMERLSGVGRMAARHLTFLTYLNDVTDGGETEFYYQKLKVEPKKGRTIICPTDWTHTHRGISSPTQEKYIVTGWFSFFQ